MRFSEQRVRIIGFTITGVGPIGRVFIPATDEMLVLYGINGAGKSTLINAIVEALQGRGRGVEVHIAVDRPFERGDLGSMADDLLRALLRAGTDSMNSVLNEIGHYPQWNPSEYGLPASTSSQYRNPGDFFLGDNNLGAAVEGMLRWHLQDESPLAAVRSEIAAQGLFTLRPIGDVVGPRWQLLISAVEDETAPATREFLSWCRARWVDWFAAGGSDEDAESIREDFIERGLIPEGFREDVVFAVDRPAWVPHPLLDFGELEAEPGLLPPGLVSEGLDPYDTTIAYVVRREDDSLGLICAMDEESLVLHPHVDERLHEVQERANIIMQLLVDDPPVLEVTVTHPDEWLYGAPPIRWGALDLPSLRHVELEGLSGFQRRWAAFAIGLAAQGHVLNSDLRDVFLVVDEPERAAHPRAITHLAQGLARLGEDYGAHVIVASHSADFLSPSAARLTHVRRDADGRGIAEPLDAPLAAGLAEVQERLGVAPAEVLQLIRVFLIVEGQHDLGVLDAVVGDALHARRVHMMAMRGTRNLLTLLDSQFLMSFTDAAFVVAPDRTNTSKIRRSLDGLRRAFDDSTPDRARHQLMRKALAPLENGTSEERTLAELLQAAARAGTLDRLYVQALSKPDIIEYLPVSEFIPDARSWTEAKRNWPRGTPFKEWLRSLGAKVSAKSLAAIAATLDEVPNDFTELVETCEQANQHPLGRTVA